jgi:ribosomal protein S5
MGNPKKGYKSKDTKIDWLERVVAIQRVTKVVKGGKKNELPSSCSCWG